MRQLRKTTEPASVLRQKGFVLVGVDGNLAIMRNAYGAVVKAIDDLAKYCNLRPAEPKKELSTFTRVLSPSPWKEECTVPVCSKQVISTSRGRVPEFTWGGQHRMQRVRVKQKFNPNNRKQHRDRTRIVEVLADI